MKHKRLILDSDLLEIVIQRLVIELRENHGDFSQSAIIGLQPRGIVLAKMIHQQLEKQTGKKILYGELDSTFYRDDFRRTGKPLIPNTMFLEFIVEDKKVILIDDVLYTGRSVRSALNALADFGRPLNTELLTLIDRRFNRELPIQPDYTGVEVDTRAHDKVIVELTDDKKVWILTEEQTQ
ncbi:MAG: bifunctional pyr operon transcriptional regulator/uracil phosphoribosyltransferase PyrR [Bacteroidetes bacterium]|nr:bifunctional pyr operon transcriptional regulator/uracil phosphoribosyltransferase PyrR [Bacteroidota bacterium]